jgi:hypothetical protein
MFWFSGVVDVVAAVGGNVSCIQILSSAGCNSRCHQLNSVMVVLVSPTISLLLGLGLLVVAVFNGQVGSERLLLFVYCTDVASF